MSPRDATEIRHDLELKNPAQRRWGIEDFSFTRQECLGNIRHASGVSAGTRLRLSIHFK
jgi:hypothetical protein